ncbi:hydroxylamine reductase [Natranaerovirga pectinivora]|uniref:Hydroxylamine reductase n=2 Tax=Natranaerovirga pectinivora TaxID=682400 RepID=A0A4R3MEA2_9FIRM|nr:hydroxylamine reductase [Natranaerovirga pectinivora]TCT12114.1 hydroxylamine reductase [Natranaerovirga pectinivora]
MSMFCYQCEQTAGGKACTSMGVCGKTPEVSGLQDLLIYQLKGIGFYGSKLLDQGKKINARVQNFVIDTAFSTLTNVNFDDERFAEFLKEGAAIKAELKAELGDVEGKVPAEATYILPGTLDEMIRDSKIAGIMVDDTLNEDVRSLREMLIYGLKGMAAYAHHAFVLGSADEEVNNYFFKAFGATVNDDLGVAELLDILMEFGGVNLKCMALLDSANTGTYGHPTPTAVNINNKKGPFIVISGHDLHDLKELLEQTEGKGVNIYTHGEMLPAHGYPELNKYPHLVGNFGGAWQDQQKEFDGLPGCILMTTNCLQKPKASYADRIYSTSVVGFPEMQHIEEVDGKKDFTAMIEKAIELGGFTEDEEVKEIMTGFGHNATLSHAETIVGAVKDGLIRHFFLIGGCDGAKSGRNYYTEIAEKTPADTVILTVACGKFRFNKLDHGNIGPLPRLLDVGQCNDSYSAIRIAVALAEAFECGVNDLPLSIILSWYEQKAVCILLTLLSLGIKNIHIGPSLPAFVSPNVLNVLVEQFAVKPISTPDEDLKAILG